MKWQEVQCQGKSCTLEVLPFGSMIQNKELVQLDNEGMACVSILGGTPRVHTRKSIPNDSCMQNGDVSNHLETSCITNGTCWVRTNE